MPILLFSLKKRSLFIIYLKKIDLIFVFLVSSIYPIYYLKKIIVWCKKQKESNALGYHTIK